MIELLVVVAIIGILAALIFASLQGVQERGRTAACAGNLRQIGVGVIAYTTDHNGITVPATIQDGSGVNGANDWATILVSQKYLSASPENSAADIPKTSPFRCQSGLPKVSTNDRSKFGDPAYASSDDAQGCVMYNYRSTDGSKAFYIHSWYGINAIVNNQSPDYPFWSPQDMNSATPPWAITGGRPLVALSNPSKTVGIYCGLGMHNGTISRIAARHNNRKDVNIMFMDGHVATFPIKDVQAAYKETATPYKSKVYKDLSFSTNFN